MQFQYDHQGRPVSVHVELAQIVETQVCFVVLVQTSGSRVLAIEFSPLMVHLGGLSWARPECSASLTGTL